MSTETVLDRLRRSYQANAHESMAHTSVMDYLRMIATQEDERKSLRRMADARFAQICPTYEVPEESEDDMGTQIFYNNVIADPDMVRVLGQQVPGQDDDNGNGDGEPAPPHHHHPPHPPAPRRMWLWLLTVLSILVAAIAVAYAIWFRPPSVLQPSPPQYIWGPELPGDSTGTSRSR